MPFDCNDPYSEVDCTVLDSTAKATKIRLTATGTTHWIPRSCLHGAQETRIENLWGEEVKLKVRRWFVAKEGLI